MDDLPASTAAAAVDTVAAMVNAADGLTASEVLELAMAADLAERVAGRAKLEAAAQWAALHPATPASGEATWGDAALPGAADCEETLGGPGTPGLAQFSPEPFAAALGVSTHAGMRLLADAVDLVHRLPGVWACVRALRIPSWQGRRAAELTRHLSLEAVGYVDRNLTERICKGQAHGSVTLAKLVAQAVAAYQPDLVRDREAEQKADWDVALRHGHPVPGTPGDWAATSTLTAYGDSLDLTAFYRLVCGQAARLGRLGDTDPLGARKVKAIGLLAGLQPGISDPASPLEEAAMPPPSGTGAGARTVLHLHVSLADLVTSVGGQAPEAVRCGWVERLGPATVDRIRDWAGRTDLTVRPVLDLTRDDAVDAHDPPEWMRELVILRDSHCVFPHCGRDARACDLDHIIPYLPVAEGGPPGQTRPGNLAPLCRRHHRAKTARAWTYRQEQDGSYTWTHRRHRRSYRVTPRGGGTHPVRV